MRKVTINEQASKDGAIVICPKCKYENKIFHFLWDTLPCPGCKNKIEKTDYLLMEQGPITIKKYEIYTYNEIEMFADNGNFDLKKHGKHQQGEGFLILKHQSEDVVITFIYNDGGIWKCIYSDL